MATKIIVKVEEDNAGEKYKNYQRMTEFLDKVDELEEWYKENVEKEYLKTMSDRDDVDWDEVVDEVGDTFDCWEGMKGHLNNMCFEIVEGK